MHKNKVAVAWCARDREMIERSPCGAILTGSCPKR